MTIEEYLKSRKYPGRVILCGCTDNLTPILAYCVMGRSEKSRNRVLRLNEGRLTTELYDKTLDGDDLILYSAKEEVGSSVLLGNGNHIGTIASSLRDGKTLIESLWGIYPESDSPNYTPRIVVLYNLETLCYEMAIVKKNGFKTDRIVWKCPVKEGLGHIIHTYSNDTTPLVAFASNPVLLNLGSDSESVCNSIWNCLDCDNKVAMYFFDGKRELIINKKEEKDGEN